MIAYVARLRNLAGALALLALALAAPSALAQRTGSVDPNASAVSEQQLLQQLNAIRGLGSIPDTKSYTLEQLAGPAWRHYHEVTLRWIGGVAILGILALLVLFYATRGPMRLKGALSGRKILRFSAYERFVHWMTAVCFVILGLSGLNITYGRPLLLPLMSPQAFSTLSAWAKYAHNFLSFPFTLGVVLMFFMWVADNLPTRVDIEWMKRGGGMIGHEEPPAYRFNAGEKLIFWIVCCGGSLAAISGYVLIFPFYGTGIHAMQLAEVGHSIIAMLFIGAMFVHMYMGTLGMEGAFEGMSKGTVDLTWAKEHHSLWVAQEGARTDASPSRPSAVPGE